MAGYRSHAPIDRAEAREASLMEERRLLGIIEAQLQLSPEERAKLPARTREHLYHYEKEAQMK